MLAPGPGPVSGDQSSVTFRVTVLPQERPKQNNTVRAQSGRLQLAPTSPPGQWTQHSCFQPMDRTTPLPFSQWNVSWYFQPMERSQSIINTTAPTNQQRHTPQTLPCHSQHFEKARTFSDFNSSQISFLGLIVRMDTDKHYSIMLKGIVHPKVKMMSFITHPHVVLNL